MLKNPKTSNGVKTTIADKTPKTPKNKTKKRKAEETPDALTKKKLDTAENRITRSKTIIDKVRDNNKGERIFSSVCFVISKKHQNQ